MAYIADPTKVYLRGDSVKEILARRNRTIGWLASATQMSPQHIAELLRGTSCPSAASRKSIQKALMPAKWDDLFTFFPDEISTDNS